MERVKVINPCGCGSLGTECYINGKKIGVRSVDFHVSMEDNPVFTIETPGQPDIDMLGNIRFDFTPKTLQEAAMIIRNECKGKQSDIYKAFVHSVAGALRELPEGTGLYEAAEAVVNRILGLED